MKLFRYVLFFSLFAPAISQTEIGWEALRDVTFGGAENSVWRPAFGESVRKLDKTTIVIRGYLIPLDAEKNTYALSSLSFANCYFCGGAGLETIIELEFREKDISFKVDDFRRIRGELVLNPDDPNHLIYILKNAEVL